MSGSLKNYLLLTTFIAINSKKCNEMHWRVGILLVWSIQVFIHAITQSSQEWMWSKFPLRLDYAMLRDNAEIKHELHCRLYGYG